MFLFRGSQEMLWSKEFLTKFISALTCWIETVAFQAQPEDEVKEIWLEVLPFLDTIQPFLNPQDQFYAMKVVHGLLRTRCITLLQSTYQWVVNKVKDTDKVQLNGDELQSSPNMDLQLLVLAYISDIG